LSDYFNYGFDEVSWEAYCYRRRDLGELAHHLKGAVTNFAGMAEDQITALPPEVRAMVMTGTTSLMASGAMQHGASQMMGVGGPGAMMHHPHEMGMLGVMNGSEMQQAASMMQGGPVPEGDVMAMQSMQQEAFQQNVSGAGQMMGMGQEYGMQDPNALGMYPQNMDGGATPGPVQTPTAGPGAASGPSPVASSAPAAPAAPRGGGPPQGGFRGRPIGSPAMGMRGRGFGLGRGRGRGAMFAADGAPPPIPVRPASPLPPGVPTGPRNQNRYKDRDGNAPAVDGLDYGGTQGAPLESDDRGNSRKRRGSPSQDEARSSKRR